jgi:hypothetical protein
MDISRYQGGSFLSLKSVSPLLGSLAPNPSILVQYPLFFTMARVTAHRELTLRADGRQMSAIMASFRHGMTLYSKYGLFALYRGLPVYLSHSFATTLLSHPIKRIRSPRTKSIAKILVDATTYPLLVMCTRMAAYTLEDSNWSFADCVRDSVREDGFLGGLWAGAAPFLLVSTYKEIEECLFNRLRKSYPKLDDTDAALLGFVRIGLGAVLTSPFLTMSTIIRCQSNDVRLNVPTSPMEVFRGMPWKWNLIAISVVLALGAINVALINEKHTPVVIENVEHE